MKKVFACLSAIALMLVAFGLVMQPAKVSAANVADGKFIVDPTVEEGDIPIYVMNSIFTTFPNLYDNNAQPDENYNLGRDYYWNEIKLVVPKFDAQGATGERYTVYTQGTYNETKKTAAATKVYLYAKDPYGRVTTFTSNNGVIDWGYTKVDDETKPLPDKNGKVKDEEGWIPTYEQKEVPSSTTWTHIFGDQSLSGVRYNVSGEDIVVENLYTSNVIANNADAREFANSAGHYDTDPIYIIFDGQGKAVRGAAHDSYFNKDNVVNYEYNMLFGRKDGKIVLRADVVGNGAVNGLGYADADLDKEMITVPNPDEPVVDAFGEPMLDPETGEPMYNTMQVPGENPDILTGKRYIWQWYSDEDYLGQKVNSVGYLEEGWLADRWDYAYADPNGGYVCLKFVSALGKDAVTTDDENACHNASVRALLAAGELTQEEADALLITELIVKDEDTGEEAVTYPNPYRSPVVLKVVVPKDGIMYRYGYLDYSGSVAPMHLEKFCPLFESAMLYGRHADYQAHARTYNFTATGLTTQNAVVNDESFIVREEQGEYVVEIKEGATIVPEKIISVLGMLGGYEIKGSPAKEAGSNVAAVISYKKSDVAGLEYVMDIGGTPTMRPIQYQYETVKEAICAFMDALAGYVGVTDYTYAGWGDKTYGKFTDQNIAAFFEANPDWVWFQGFYQALFDEFATAQGFTAYTAWSTNGARWGLHALYAESKAGSWPYSPDFTNLASATTNINDYQPEKSYRYATWDEFVADFLTDFNANVYGSDKVTKPADFFNNTYLSDPKGDTAKKMLAFFQEGEWKWFGDILDAACKEKEWTSWDNTDYRYYRFNVHEYINRISNGYGCGAFVDMPDPNWIGKPLEKDYSKVTFDASKYVFGDKFDLTMTVSNATTGITDDIAVKFEVVKHFTPIIKVDQSALSVALGQTSINLYDAVSAWDCEYKPSGDGVYGSDITRQYLEFVYPEGFDPNKLVPGVHTIEVIAKCPNETGIVAKTTFQVRVIDDIAPEVRLENGGQLYIVAGTQLKAEDILVYAVDNLDGDYLRNANVNWIWNVIESDYDPELSVVGDVCSGSITVVDSSGNNKKANFTLFVTGVEVPEYEAPTPTPTPTPDNGDNGDAAEGGCVSFAYVSSFIAAAGLALLILKKRH